MNQPLPLAFVGLDSDVARWLARYRPRRAGRELWDSIIGTFVMDAVVELAPARRPTAESYVWALRRFCQWGLEQGLDLDREVLLDPDTVERYCGSLTRHSQNTARSILRRIGPKLARRAPWLPPPAPIPHKRIAEPYTDQELATLVTDASRQSSPSRRRAAEAILGLGAGVGADGRWSMKVRGTDVIGTPDAVLVRLGPPKPRVVPVLARFDGTILRLAEEAGDAPLVGGAATTKNKASRAVARFESSPGRPRLSAARARSTWLLHHLRSGTRLRELASAAGFQNVASLDELLPLVPAMDEAAAARMLRGAR
jgi:hypothetical protein